MEQNNDQIKTNVVLDGDRNMARFRIDIPYSLITDVNFIETMSAYESYQLADWLRALAKIVESTYTRSQ